jgi:type II secretory pathway component PulF
VNLTAAMMEWYDDVEEEMLAFLGLIINMGVIHLPYLKDYWSQQFVCRVLFFGKVFKRKHLLQIFWMLHLESFQFRPQFENQDIKSE